MFSAHRFVLASIAQVFEGLRDVTRSMICESRLSIYILTRVAIDDGVSLLPLLILSADCVSRQRRKMSPGWRLKDRRRLNERSRFLASGSWLQRQTSMNKTAGDTLRARETRREAYTKRERYRVQHG